MKVKKEEGVKDVVQEEKKSLTYYAWAYSPALGEMYGLVEALILQQVHYRAKFTDWPQEQHGELWMVSSYKQWAESLRVVSPKKVQKAIQALLDLGVLHSGVFNDSSRNRTQWYRVNYQVLQESLARHLGRSHSQIGHIQVDNLTTSPIGQSDQLHVVNLTKSYISNKEIYKEAGQGGKLTIQAGEIPGEKTGESGPEKIHEVEIVEKYIPVEIDIKEPPVKKSASSHKAILESLKVANGTSTAKVSNTPASVTHLWRTLVPVYHKATGMMPEIPMVTKGQLGQISRALGSRADAVVECVIKEWVSYSKYVAAQTGLKIAPESPHVGFLLKNVGLASFFSESRLQLIAKPKPKPPKQDTIAPKSGTMSVACDLEDEEDGTIWKPSS